MAEPITRPRHVNGFDTLRLLGAVLVVVGHSYPVLALDSPKFGGVSLNGLGVMIFFALSGYLITRSLTSDPSASRFIAKRALRIFPALAVVLFVTTLIVGPLVTQLTGAAYFRDAQTWSYLGRNLLLWTDHHLPGVFTTVPYPHSVNTSLWTLPIEVTMYALTPILILIATRLGRLGQVALLVGSVVAAWIYFAHPYHTQIQLYGFVLRDALQYMPSYVLGSLFATLHLDRSAPIVARAAIIASGIAMLVLSVIPTGNASVALALIPVSALTLFGGLSPRLYSPHLARVGDLSYGLYLWSFLAQQSLVFLIGPKLMPLQLAGLTFLLCLPIAWLSWHFVERPALTLKPAPADRDLVPPALAAA